MLQDIRKSAQGTLAKGIIILITIPFVLTGAETLLSSGGAQKVAKVNGEEITQQQLEEEIFLTKRRLMGQLGDNLDPAMLDDKRLASPALESLISRTILEQTAQQAGMTVSEAEINRIIMQTPEFQEEDGRFSAARYNSVLMSAGFTPALYKKLFRNDVLRGQFASGIAATDFVTPQELALQLGYIYQTRDIRYLTLDKAKVQSNIQVSEQELTDFYQQNPQYFTQAEQVFVDYIELSLADFTPEISEAELQDAYQNELQNTQFGAQRQVSHILLNDTGDAAKQKLQALKRQLAEGADFAELAKAHSEDVGSNSQGGFLGELQTDIYPAEFVAAAERLEQGQVSDVVETEAGLHLIRVDQLVKFEPPSFAERKDALLKELRESKASPLFWAAVEQLKDMAFNAPDLQQPAKALNVQVKTSQAITRQGGQGLFANPNLYNEAFSDSVLNSGFNSEVIEVANNKVVVLRLNKHVPEQLLEQNQVADKLLGLTQSFKAALVLNEQAETIAKALQQGESVEALAKQYSAEWQVLLAASRNVANDSSAEIVAHALSLPPVDSDKQYVEQKTLMNGNVSVMVVSNAQLADADKVNPMEAASIQAYLSQAGGADSFQLVQQRLTESAKIKRY